jgi:hypothetical protein
VSQPQWFFPANYREPLVPAAAAHLEEFTILFWLPPNI